MEAQALHNMNKVAAALVKTPGEPADLTSTLRHIAQTAQAAFGADACVIVGFNPLTSKFIGSQTAGAHVQAESKLPHKKPRLKGVTQQVLREGMLLVEDVERQPQYNNRFRRLAGIRAFAGIAMRTRHRQRPLGVIYLDFKEPRTFTPTDRESFENFAVQASFLLQETLLVRHYEQVARIGQEVNHSLDTIDALFQVLQTYVDEVLDGSHTLVLAVSQPQTQWLNVHLREYGQTILMNTRAQGACQHVIKTQESWFIQQSSKETANLPFQLINITGTEEKESFIFVPLLLRGISLGVLSIQHALPDAYGQEDLFILQLLASYAALGLHNIRLYSSLRQLNETGQLLTQQLESEQTLQTTVEKIREATKADIVVLYPYESHMQNFVLPPRIAGTLLDPNIQTAPISRSDNIASLMLRQKNPIFAKKSVQLYTKLQGDIPIRQRNFQEREHLQSTATLPLYVGDESVGVLFINFYRRTTSVSQIKTALNRLFRNTCGPWYANPGHLQAYDLSTDYQRLLKKYTPKVLEQLVTEQLTSVQGKQRLQFNHLKSQRSFTNPLLVMAELSPIRVTYLCITHGDFNYRNLLVDSTGHTWMIDFEKTGQSHILRDVATLDSVIRFQLLAAEEATLEERLQMEEALCSIEHFSQVERLTTKFSTTNQALAKAYTIVVHLRMLAHKLVVQNPNDDISEYYIALLYNALNALRFSSLSSGQREHALLSASLLADRLGLGN